MFDRVYGRRKRKRKGKKKKGRKGKKSPPHVTISIDEPNRPQQSPTESSFMSTRPGTNRQEALVKDLVKNLPPIIVKVGTLPVRWSDVDHEFFFSGTSTSDQHSTARIQHSAGNCKCIADIFANCITN